MSIFDYFKGFFKQRTGVFVTFSSETVTSNIVLKVKTTIKNNFDPAQSEQQML
jgi:hypothetical protein